MKTGNRVVVPSLFREGTVIGHARLRIQQADGSQKQVERLDIIVLDGNKSQVGEPQTLVAARADGTYAPLGWGHEELKFRGLIDQLYDREDPVLVAKRFLEEQGYEVKRK